MRQILLVARQELIANIRRPGFIIMTLLVPALGLVALLILSVFGGQVGTFLESQFTPGLAQIGYVDHSGLIHTGDSTGTATFVAYPDEESARVAVLAGDIDSLVVLPPDYMETGNVQVYGTGTGFSTFAAADSGQLRGFLLDQILAEKVDPLTLERARSPLNVEAVTIDESGEVSTDSAFDWLGGFVVPYVFAVLFVITIFTTSGFLLQGVAEEKEGRIIEILLSSISPTELLAGKILGLGALGLIQLSVWIGTGVALLAVSMSALARSGAIDISPSTIALALVYFVLGYLLFATLMAVAGSMGTTQRESQQIAGIFSMAAAVPWMVMGIIIANPDSILAVIFSYFPLTAPVMMLMRLGFGPVPPAQIIVSLSLLLAAILVSLWGGARIFRTSLLMYGKRPSLKDLAQAFKQA